MNCYTERDLNPLTCRFTKKCKNGFERNQKFLCRKTKKKNSIKMMYNMLDGSIQSPLISLDKMKESVNYESPKYEQSQRVFPKNSKDLSEDGKDYIIFEDSGTGIMLADTLYKDGKMLQLSKALSKTYKQPPVDWYLSEKYDGLRGIWTGKELVARPSKKDGVMKGKVFNYVPEWFINLLPKGVSLDGELWLGRGRFQEISGLSNYKISKKITKEYLDTIWKEVKFMVFDIPHINEPYIDRLEELKQIVDIIKVKQGIESYIQLSTFTIVKDYEHLSELYTDYTLNGAEGIILREPNSYYETKRSKLLLKMKLSNDGEATVTGYLLGSGKYKGMLGSLICIMNGKTFNIGTGFNDIMRSEYNDNESKYYIPLGSIVNFGYMELTKDGIPRHPVYRGIRTDI
jgi:DNA ligase-1